MKPEIWGPAFWFVIHTLTFNYPENPSYLEKRNHYDFFRILQYMLPCETCRKHYTAYFQENPIEIHLESRLSFIQWAINLHNSVNRRKGSREYSFADVQKEYDTTYTSQNADNYFCKSTITSSENKENTSCPLSQESCPLCPVPTQDSSYVIFAICIILICIGLLACFGYWMWWRKH